MEAGKLRYKIEIYKVEEIFDEYGSQTSSTVLIYPCVRADMEDGNLYRQVVNDTVYSSQSRYFIIRDNYRVNVGMVVKFKGAKYRINAIKEISEKRAQELVTELYEE